MTPIPYDLAIIGGGPAALACALGAGRRRLSVLLLEKNLPGRKLLISGKRSRGHLRHLFMSKEMLGPTLLATHNLTYYQRLVARAALERNRFAEFYRERMAASPLGRGNRRLSASGSQELGGNRLWKALFFKYREIFNKLLGRKGTRIKYCC